MKSSAIIRSFSIATGLSIVWSSCMYNTPETPIYSLTQQQLDAATIIPAPEDIAIIGDPFGAFGADTVTTIHKMRDLFSNISLSQPIGVGTIMTRKAYYYTGTQFNRDSLINIVVMVKRESGYYPEGGDWEYVDIKYDKNTNYALNPNGILPLVTNDINRGKITKCANCHARQENDFVFHRN